MEPGWVVSHSKLFGCGGPIAYLILELGVCDDLGAGLDISVGWEEIFGLAMSGAMSEATSGAMSEATSEASRKGGIFLTLETAAEPVATTVRTRRFAPHHPHLKEVLIKHSVETISYRVCLYLVDWRAICVGGDK